jgi:hypothetical protein
VGSLAGHIKELDKLSAVDRNFVPRQRMLNAAHRDQLLRLKEGASVASVVYELRRAYAFAYELRPILGNQP